jgi:hypothetical protein
LSAAERIQLAEDIWDSIAAAPETVPGLSRDKAYTQYMCEEILKRFFIREVDADVLAADLEGSMTEERNATYYHIEDMEEQFKVEPEHLISVCDAVLNDKIEAKYLRIIGFCIAASDHFEYDTDTPEGEIVGETVLDWSAPKINYPLTIDNVRKFRERLVNERNLFTLRDALRLPRRRRFYQSRLCIFHQSRAV